MLFLSWTAIPILAVFIAASAFNLFYNARYVAIAFPAYGLILALGLGTYNRRWLQATLLAAVLLAHGTSLANYYGNPRYAQEDARAAAHYLETHVQATDAILAVGTLSALPYYYQGSVSLTPLYHPIGPSQSVADVLRRRPQPQARLWIVAIRPWQVDPEGVITAHLAQQYEIVQHQRFPGVDIYAYQVAQ